jgi:3-oxoacyl-[acyl-carrier-protein] synthase II
MGGYHKKRTVITGIGVVTPIGVGKNAFWKNLSSGISGIGFLKAFPCDHLPFKLAAEVTDFDPTELLNEKKFLKVMSRDIQLGVTSASLSMKDSGILSGMIPEDRLGVVFGTGRISSAPQDVSKAVEECADSENDFQYTRWGEDSMGKITPLWLLRRMPNMPAAHISIEHNARGPNNTITSRDSSALLALSEAINVIERGSADCMIVGACSSNIHPMDIARLSLSKGLTKREDDPTRACRPFDIERDGTIVGEGAATFIVEEYEHAVRRGADIYCEILGVGSGCDGNIHSEESKQGTGLVRAMEAAIRNSHIRPDELGHINAHGKSTQKDDLIEAQAYERAFGNVAHKIPLTALKSYFGHFDAGSGAVELAGSILALRNSEIPRTLNYETPDPQCRLNVVHEQSKQLSNSLAMSVSRTSMGQSAAVVIRAI